MTFAAGDVVTTERDRGLYRVKEGDSRRLYTFKAEVERVIDGDTVWLKIDYGFKFRQPQKIRLIGVDTAELPSGEGERAKAWVQEKLRAVPFVIITTTKVGMYGRYIADVFYGGGTTPERVAAKGRYLNAEMVREGIAVGLG